MNTSTATYKCLACCDTGYEIYSKIVPGYDDETPIRFAKPCTHCSGSYRYGESGLPDMYHDCDMTKFDKSVYGSDISATMKIVNSFFRDFEKWNDNGKGLYIWSKTKGSGKTFLASCLAGSVREKYDVMVKFVTAPDYLDTVAASWKRDPAQSDIVTQYKTCDILILDDLGVESNKDWRGQEMFNLINRRISNHKMTIVTSNYRLSELPSDDRVVQRLFQMCITLQLPEQSIRAVKAEDENRRFVQQIIKGVE